MVAFRGPIGPLFCVCVGVLRSGSEYGIMEGVERINEVIASEFVRASTDGGFI